ncbi:sulfatase [Nocardiopsis dassonvillei]|uniref:sulfatase n=1 Tax=Nocardiopsis dassonvillei TaxID=2014 RepID=UPI00200FA3D5|nr:sulfatase [Nocardiopsis dassonvillei]MCK9873494.1 sulfatase [Nocardiopsis dassonvillei]
MKAIILMFDSLNRHMLSPYGDTFVRAPHFARLASRAVTFDNFYAGSMPCMPARREMHTGRHNFLHRSWGPLEPFDDSMPQMLRDAGIHTHLVSDHPHYWEDGGGTYHTRYSTWEFFRGQEGEPWKGVVAPGDRHSGRPTNSRYQDRVNRSYMPSEAEHMQTRTVDAGLEFIATNASSDDWMLQLELFDPHEPFFTHQRYKDLYPHEYSGAEFDWPQYRKVVEPDEQVDHARAEYAALVSMCDASLGRVLDAMDEHALWDDTLLIVNTDHGFLLGEHGWWAKSVQPWFNELVHLPMFLWDPRNAESDTRRGDLAQTIDIAPTVLKWFGLEPTPDMQGTDLALSRGDETTGRDGALFGIHGGHVNVTDGRYVYMRAPVGQENGPLEEFTLMPTHMRARFSVGEMQDWDRAEPFGFTKGLRTMRMRAPAGWVNPWQHGTLLFDLENDPNQEHPLDDPEVELRMLRLLARRMHESDSPASQFTRLGIPFDAEPGKDHLLVAEQSQRAAAVGEPLPRIDDLLHRELLRLPLRELLQRSDLRPAIEQHLPALAAMELVAISPGTSLVDVAAFGAVTAEQLRLFTEALPSTD